jgi:hypothetical protein
VDYVNINVDTAYDESTAGASKKRDLKGKQPQSSAHKRIKLEECVKMVKTNLQSIGKDFLLMNYAALMDTTSAIVYDMSTLLALTARSYMDR